MGPQLLFAFSVRIQSPVIAAPYCPRSMGHSASDRTLSTKGFFFSISDTTAMPTSIASTKLVFSGPKTIYQQVLPNSHHIGPSRATHETVSEVSSPYLMKPGLSHKPAFNFGVPLSPRPSSMCPDVIQTQQRLEQTSSSLASTLEAAEKEIIAEEADK